VEIPSVVIERLPLYARALDALAQEGREVVSSQELGSRLGVTPAQIRKDLSYFGRFGKQGRGYNVQNLLSALRQILGLDRQWRMALVGVGRLGRAIVQYEGFAPQGFRIVHAFDADPRIVGQEVNGLLVRDARQLEEALAQEPVEIGIVAVPAAAAQEVIERLVRAGVKAILNYAPITARVPRDVQIRRVDPVLALQSMTYYLRQGGQGQPAK
jgi:redox-sensing transcriptional repressor